MPMLEQLAARTSDERLSRLLSYAAADPANVDLRIDASQHALDIGEPDVASELLRSNETLSDRELNLLGLADMQLGKFDDAAITFTALMEREVADPAISFNLAWSMAMQKQFGQALAHLSDEVTNSLPEAAMLKVQLLHETGAIEGAESLARTYLARFPEHEGLAAAVSVLALDIEDLKLARECALRANSHPDARTTLGTLALGEQRLGEAESLFDDALQAHEGIPRAWIGRGLTRLLQKDERAAADIDRGAELFVDHIGSWIAAGWARLVAGDLPAARKRFERARAIDDSFAESHGSIAVIDVLEDKDSEAVRQMKIARRLDKGSFSAAFAETLRTAKAGRDQDARAMLDKIMETKVNERGDTAAAALARMGLGRG